MSSKNDFPKWQKQIEELASHIEQDVVSNLRIFKHYKEIVRGNQAVGFPNGARFHLWVERNHYYALLAALRKVFLSNDKNEVSLLKIINELVNSGNIVDARNYPSLLGIDGNTLIGASAAASASKGFFGVDGKLDIQKLTQDSDFLTKTLRPQLKFTNEKVLHVQKNPKALTPDEAELELNIEKLKTMFREYRLFLTGSDTAWSIEDASWISIFSTTWLDQTS